MGGGRECLAPREEMVMLFNHQKRQDGSGPHQEPNQDRRGSSREADLLVIKENIPEIETC